MLDGLWVWIIIRQGSEVTFFENLRFWVWFGICCDRCLFDFTCLDVILAIWYFWLFGFGYFVALWF